MKVDNIEEMVHELFEMMFKAGAREAMTTNLSGLKLHGMSQEEIIDHLWEESDIKEHIPHSLKLK